MDDPRSELASIALKAARAAVRQAQQRDPRFATLVVSTTAHAARRRPQGWTKHPDRIVAGFLGNRGFLHMTNEQIAETVSSWFDGAAVSASIMTKGLPAETRKRLQAQFDTVRMPIKVRANDTLSTLKRAIRAGGRDRLADARVITVSFADGYVVMNGKEYKIDPSRRHPSVRVAGQYLRLDVLRALAEGCP